jgi:lysophospholipase L1-like esterase
MSAPLPRRTASVVAAAAALGLLGVAPATAHQPHGAGHDGHGTEHHGQGHGAEHRGHGHVVGHGHGAGHHDRARPKQVDHVNLGDSYSAAIGTGGIAPSPLGSECLQGDGPDHVSELDAQKHLKLVLDAACSGATTDRVEEIAGTAPVERALRKAELVTLTLGGNDVGWIDVIRACSLQGTDEACDTAVDSAQRLIMPAAKSAGETVAAIELRTEGEVVVMGYPHLFSEDPSSPLISPQRAEQLNDLTDDLNNALEEAVEQVDAAEFVHVAELFEGHAVDSADPWIYWNPADPTDPNNLHPTETGYLAGYYTALTSEVDLVHRGR